MGNWLLRVIETFNSFWLSFMDKIVILAKIITSGGRKMVVTMFTVFCLTLLGVEQIVLLHTISDLLVICIAGVSGFFFGINILGDHLLARSNKE